MRTVTTLITAIVIAAWIIPIATASTRGDRSVYIDIEADSPEQREMAEWALERFTRAGLHLPSVIIEFAGSDLSGCGGTPGRTYFGEIRPRVKICWNDRFILLHELGHVWETFNVSESQHEPFMATRQGVESWADDEVAWDSRGIEHAANVIAWGLLEDPYPVSRTYPNDPDSLTDAFRFLTGADPLHDGGPGIQRPDRSLYEGRSNPAFESGQ